MNVGHRAASFVYLSIWIDSKHLGSLNDNLTCFELSNIVVYSWNYGYGRQMYLNIQCDFLEFFKSTYKFDVDISDTLHSQWLPTVVTYDGRAIAYVYFSCIFATRWCSRLWSLRILVWALVKRERDDYRASASWTALCILRVEPSRN